MSETVLRLELRLTRPQAIAALTMALMTWYAPELGSENVVLTTYYPAPSGIYTRMITTNETLLARDGGNVAVGSAVGGAKFSVMNGNVGVGTTNPDNLLEVQQSGGAENGIEIQFDNQSARLRWHDPGDYWYSAGIHRGDAGKFKINYGGNVGAANHFVMNTSGRVALQHNNPQADLDVNGEVVVGRYVGAIGTGRCVQVTYNTTGTTPCGANRYATMTTGLISKYVMMPFYRDQTGNASTAIMLCCTCPAGGCPSL